MRCIIQSTLTDERKANNNQIIQEVTVHSPTIYVQSGYDTTDNQMINVADFDDNNQVIKHRHQ